MSEIEANKSMDVVNDVKNQATDDSDAVQRKSEQKEDGASKLSSEYLRTYVL